jgi:hypothetical protein
MATLQRDAGFWLLAIGYWLLTSDAIGNWLLAIGTGY